MPLAFTQEDFLVEFDKAYLFKILYVSQFVTQFRFQNFQPSFVILNLQDISIGFFRQPWLNLKFSGLKYIPKFKVKDRNNHTGRPRLVQSLFIRRNG